MAIKIIAMNKRFNKHFMNSMLKTGKIFNQNRWHAGFIGDPNSHRRNITDNHVALQLLNFFGVAGVLGGQQLHKLRTELSLGSISLTSIFSNKVSTASQSSLCWRICLLENMHHVLELCSGGSVFSAGIVRVPVSPLFAFTLGLRRFRPPGISTSNTCFRVVCFEI